MRSKDSGYFYTWSHFLFIHSHTLKIINMSIITLTPIEFDLFKNIADFYFDFTVTTGFVHVIADTKSLASLGY